jgi:hypothetical protein
LRGAIGGGNRPVSATFPNFPYVKLFRLMRADGKEYPSADRGTLGGNRASRIYGRLDCPSAIAALPRGYAERRVFFADEATAVAAGYRPCGRCMRAAYEQWMGQRVRPSHGRGEPSRS